MQEAFAPKSPLQTVGFLAMVFSFLTRCPSQTSFGTAHVPNPTDEDGFPISEAQSSAAYLIQ